MKANNPGIAALAQDIRLGVYSDLAGIGILPRRFMRTLPSSVPKILSTTVSLMLCSGRHPGCRPDQESGPPGDIEVLYEKPRGKVRHPGNPLFKVFTSPDGIPEFSNLLPGIVVKPDG
jgi:hypothetical protein